MKTKILITGSSGFLGSRLAYYFRERYDLLLPSHSELNISREEAVKAYMEEHRPEVVIHCAALSNTWYCEQHPEESHRANVQGTVRIAKACKQIGAKLIFMSSDQVYNGTPLLGPLREDDLLQPVNIYGQHKLEAEQRAQWNLPDQERFSEQERNLTMDCSLIEKHGIHFPDSVEGVQEAILRPFRTA